jgi:membrane protease YdiL (CAAX protease family)
VWVTLLVTSLVTLAALALPVDWKALGVACVFLGSTYWLVIRSNDTEDIARHGLSLAGLTGLEPLDGRHLLREGGRAAAWSLGTAAVIFPAFWLGFVVWHAPAGGFTLPPLAPFAEDALGQLLVVALPEEAFYRGYLQTALEERRPASLRLFGARVGSAILLTSALFAVGHIATEPHVTRLAVFFPSLVFGWLRARTGGIGASIGFHALCNLFASFLLRGYGLVP